MMAKFLFFKIFFDNLNMDKFTNEQMTLNNEAFFTNMNLNQFYTYTGSLTTPPCTESVKWYVMATECIVPSDFMSFALSYQTMHGNYRDTKPLNGRKINGVLEKCDNYCASTGCKWTSGWSCPWAKHDGTSGRATADGSFGYHCCCEARKSADESCGGVAKQLESFVQSRLENLLEMLIEEALQ